MLATYTLKVDIDRDGYFNDGVLTSDPLNLIPTPVTWADIDTRVRNGGETLTTERIETAYGTNVLRCVTTANTGDGMQFGRALAGTADDIPVDASTEYTASVWVRGVANYSGVDCVVQVFDQAIASLGSDTITLTGDWQRVDVTFTTGVSATHVFYTVRKTDSAALLTFDATGFMLVAGAVSPASFNAGHATNAYDDITAYVREMHARYGMDDPFGEVAPPAELVARLANTDGEFLPENASSDYYGLLNPGALVRLQAAYSGTTYTLWTGRLKGLNVAPGAWQTPRDAELTAQDMTLDLVDGEYKPTLQTNVTASEALMTLFNADIPAVRWPYEDQPADVDDYTDFEAGKTVQAWIGDNSENEARRGVQPYQHIRDLVAPEGGGRFFWNAATGKWTFLNREHDILEASAATFTGDEFLQDRSFYVYGDLLVNKVSFDFVPREIGAAGTVVYSATAAWVPYGRSNPSVTFTARYSDPDNPTARVGVIDGIAPVANTDYQYRDFPDAASDDHTDKFTVTVTYYADRAEVTIANNDTGTSYQEFFQLRGTPLYSYDRLTVTAQDDSSIAEYGIHEQPPRLLPSVDTETFARALAQWTIARFAEPFGRFSVVTLQANASAANMTQALARQVGDKITITVAHLGHDRDYAIAGVEHEVIPSRGEHFTRWALTPLPVAPIFIWDDPVYGVFDSDNIWAL